MLQCDLQNQAMKWFMPSIMSFHFKETLFDRVYQILTGHMVSNFEIVFLSIFLVPYQEQPTALLIAKLEAADQKNRKPVIIKQ